MFPEIVRRFSYIPAVRRLVIAAGLRDKAQKMYHQRFAPAGGILALSYGGSQARFFTPTIRELRGLEFFSSGGVEEFQRLVHMVHDGEVFFDVGAQYGAYAYLVSNAVGTTVRVIAFEPFPRDYALLKKNAELNPMACVQCINAALSDRDGEVAMSSSEGETEFCPRIGASTPNSQNVVAVRGDALISAGKVPFPNVIKLDVEGHEMAVLRGMVETLGDPRCHSIYCEIHDALLPAGDDPAALIAFLRSKGFNSISESPRPNHYIFAEKVPASGIV
jgi:FkbM family methyltransferase